MRGRTRHKLEEVMEGRPTGHMQAEEAMRVELFLVMALIIVTS